MSEAPNVAIIVVHFGDPAVTSACLASITADPSPVNRTVVVVDNDSSFRGTYKGVTIVSCPENPGFGAAVNRGIASLDGRSFDVYIVLNNDIVIRPGYLQAAHEALQRSDSRTAIVAGPLFLDESSTRIWYAGGGVNFLTGTVRQGTSLKESHLEHEVGFVPGAAFAIKPEAWTDSGGFDPSYFLYSEDVDLCLRLRRRGWRLMFDPNMVAVHSLGRTTGSQTTSPLYLYYVTRNRLRPFRPFAYRLYLALLHSGYVPARALLAIARNRHQGLVQAKALLAGHRDALKELFHRQPIDVRKGDTV